MSEAPLYLLTRRAARRNLHLACAQGGRAATSNVAPLICDDAHLSLAGQPSY